MTIRFWGVRGSCPTPLKPSDVTGKISSALQQITSKDIIDFKSKERFISTLPRHLSSTVGGNTACVEVRLEDNSLLIFDCGTGLRSLNENLITQGETISDYHIFMTHFHYDHLIGMPYFAPLYQKSNRITFYSPYAKMEKIIRSFFRKPYHPVPFDAFGSQINFRVMDRGGINMGSSKIDWIKRNHPDGSIAYKVREGKGTFIFSTDTELEERDFKKTRKNTAFFKEVDLLVIDGQYSLGEAIEKMSWGHSSYSMAIEFALEFDIKRLLIFHHEPMNGDRDLLRIEKIAQTYKDMLSRKQGKQLDMSFAMEEESFGL